MRGRSECKMTGGAFGDHPFFLGRYFAFVNRQDKKYMRMAIKKVILYIWAPLLFLLFCFCLDEKEEVIRQKLDIILKDDLEAIIEDVDSSALLDEPYFELLDYKVYDDGYYSRMAIADFYFMKSVAVKISRKYRYVRKMGVWDRYHNKYNTIVPKTNETEN